MIEDPHTIALVEQFTSYSATTPHGFVSWRNLPQPRDMSWGFVNTPKGKIHVQAGDVIITMTDTSQWVITCDELLTLCQQKQHS